MEENVDKKFSKGCGVEKKKVGEGLEKEVLKDWCKFYWGSDGGKYYEWMGKETENQGQSKNIKELQNVEESTVTDTTKKQPTPPKEIMEVRKSQKRKIDDEALLGTLKEQNPTCKYYLKKKNRRCRLAQMRGASYCAEHINSQEDYLESESESRVPCPYDPNHNVAIKSMKKHLKKCNSKPPKEAEVPYYRKSINLQKSVREELGRSNDPVQPLNIKTMTESAKLTLIAEVIKYHQENMPKIIENINMHPILKEDIDKKEAGESALRHWNQSGSLINLMEEGNLFRDDTVYIEYGSGRGGLSYDLAIVLAKKGLMNCKIFLVDRSSPRYKWDNKAKRSDEYKSIEIERVKLDVADLFIENLGGSNGLLHYQHIVGIAKHMCGSATDIALRSLLNTTTDVQKKVIGFVFATCCHHRIEYFDFLGADSLMPHFDQAKHSALKQLAAWATDGYYEASYIKEDTQVPEDLSTLINDLEATRPQIKLKHYIGRLVKEILDNARRAHIQKESMLNCNLVRYVELTTTPENLAIVAHSIAQ